MWKQLIRLLGGHPDDLPLPPVEQLLPADRPIPTLKELVENANVVLESEYDYGPDAFERSPQYTPLDLLRMQFSHCWCHHFAASMQELTGWPVMKAIDAKGGLVHYLNRDPQGRWVDVTGFVEVEGLCRRYGLPALSVLEDSEFKRQRVLDDDSMSDIMAAMLYLPHQPYIGMRQTIRLWVRHGRTGLDGPWRWRPAES